MKKLRFHVAAPAPLPETFFEMGGDPLAEVVAAVVSALVFCRADQVVSRQHTLAGEHQHQGRQSKPNDEPDQASGFPPRAVPFSPG